MSSLKVIIISIMTLIIAACKAGPSNNLEKSGPIYLEESGPIVVSSDGQIIENLKITSTEGPGILVQDHSNVVIRNVEIHHSGGAGIDLLGTPNILIENAVIIHTGSPPSGPNPNENLNNIKASFSPDIVIRRVRLIQGSSGIYLINSDRAHLSFIEGHDFRGPFPRGQLVQFDKSDNCILEDFSSENPRNTSWVEDNVSIFNSSNCIIRRGLVDGNNSPTGVGIMVEQTDANKSGVLVEDIDAIHQGNGCFSAYPGNTVTFNRTQCRENICQSQGRVDPRVDPPLPAPPPESGGTAWASKPSALDGSLYSKKVVVMASSYFALCDLNKIAWHESAFLGPIDTKEKNFVLRKPIRNKFLWE